MEQTGTLIGWMEISGYLGVDKTTAQRWEKQHGLPVRHAGGLRGRVEAERTDLDRWRREAGMDAHTAQPGRRLAPGLLVTVLGLVLGSGGMGALLGWRLRAPAPAAWRVTERELIVSDASGRERWRRRFHADLLPGRGWLGDLDGDGTVEMLFAYHPTTRAETGAPLICFSERGEEKWRFAPGRKVADDLREWSPIFFANNFRVLTVEGRRRIVVTSNHSNGYPDQVAVLDENGKMLGEYFHSGHLLSMDHADVDGDGIEEVLLAGVNNGEGRATLVILDPRRVSGASTQPPGHPTQLRGFGPGAEKAVVLFPRSCVTEKQHYPFNYAGEVSAGARLITVQVSEWLNGHGPRLWYRLDPNLSVTRVTASGEVQDLHRLLQRLKLVDHEPFLEDELEQLRRSVEVRWKQPRRSSARGE